MSEDGKEQLVVKGSTLKGIIKRRITIPPVGQAFDRAIGKQETIIKEFVNNNAVAPADKDRIIPNLIIAEDKNRGVQDGWRTRYENLADKTQEIAEYSNLGWDIILDTNNNKFVFDIMEGKNLTSEQEQLPPVIFSTKFDNINSRHYTESSLNYKNVAYAGGKGQDEERLIQQLGESKGLARREVFIDCSQANDIEELKSMGEHNLDDFKIVETFEASVIPFGSFNYMEDWDLGDIVTVMDRKWGITLNTRITEIKEIYEVNGFNLECVFGNSIPNLLDKIKQQDKRTQNLITK